jgi:hypothetical protein
MERIEDESARLVRPGLADEFIRDEAFQRLQAPGAIVGCDEVGEMAFQLIVRLMEVAFDGGALGRVPGRGVAAVGK